jgi:hypothetical protein
VERKYSLSALCDFLMEFSKKSSGIFQLIEGWTFKSPHRAVKGSVTEDKRIRFLRRNFWTVQNPIYTVHT